MSLDYTITAAARKYQVNPATVWRWVKRGVRGVKLEAVKVGGHWRVSQAAIDRFTAATTAAAMPPELEPTKLPKLSEEVLAGLRRHGFKDF